MKPNKDKKLDFEEFIKKHATPVYAGEFKGKKVKLLAYRPPTMIWYMDDDIALRHYNCIPFVLLWLLIVVGVLLATFTINIFISAILIPVLALSPNPFKYDVYIRFYPILNNTYRNHWRFKFLGMDFYIFNYKYAFNYKIFSPNKKTRNVVLKSVLKMEQKFAERTM